MSPRLRGGADPWRGEGPPPETVVDPDASVDAATTWRALKRDREGDPRRPPRRWESRQLPDGSWEDVDLGPVEPVDDPPGGR